MWAERALVLRQRAMSGEQEGEGKPRGEMGTLDEVAIRLRIESLEEGGYVATRPDVPVRGHIFICHLAAGHACHAASRKGYPNGK